MASAGKTTGAPRLASAVHREDSPQAATAFVGHAPAGKSAGQARAMAGRNGVNVEHSTSNIERRSGGARRNSADRAGFEYPPLVVPSEEGIAVDGLTAGRAEARPSDGHRGEKQPTLCIDLGEGFLYKRGGRGAAATDGFGEY